MHVTLQLLKRIKTNYLCLEEFLILYSKFYNTQWLDSYRPMDIHYHKLRKEKLLSLSNVITDKGIQVIKDIESTTSKKELLDPETEFEAWWKLYPTDDRVKHFPASRRFKTNKRRAKQLFAQLLREGITAEDLNTALKNEIAFRVNSSIKKNSLTFLQNPAT